MLYAQCLNLNTKRNNIFLLFVKKYVAPLSPLARKPRIDNWRSGCKLWLLVVKILLLVMDEARHFPTQPLLYVTIATLINNLVNFGAQAMAARSLGVERFGVLSLAIALLFITATVGELGLDLTLIRLFNRKAGDEQAQKVLLGSVLLFRFALFFLLFLLAVPLAYLLVHGFTRGKFPLSPVQGQWLFICALFTGGLLFFWTFLQSVWQCFRSFAQLTLYLLLYAGLRLASLLVVYLRGSSDLLIWLLFIYTIPTLLLLVIAFVTRRRGLIKPATANLRVSVGALREVLSYSKWVALSAVAYTVMPYLIRFLLMARASVRAVGIFSAGMTFTLAFTSLNAAVRTVLFPQVTALERKKEMKGYLRKLTKIAPTYFIFALIGILLLGAVQWFLLGANYREAMPVFWVTSPVFALLLFIGMATMLLHTMMRPDLDAYVDTTRLLVVALLSLLVAPLGVVAVATVYALCLLAGATIKLLLIRRWLQF